MEKIQGEKAAEIVEGKFRGPAGAEFNRVVIDSRQVKEKDLFVAIVGENNDGHNFIEEAWKRGASGVLVSKEISHPKDKFTIQVENTLSGLQSLARYNREVCDPLVIGITGSNGKTTTKDLIAAVLKTTKKVLKTRGNLNNQYGLPLTLLELDRTQEVCVLEMGMNAEGEIALLGEIANPQIGVLTNIGPAHLEFLGDLQGVARAKGELIEALPPDGLLVFNGDDPILKEMAASFSGEKISFGFNEGNIVRGHEVKKVGCQHTVFGVSFKEEYHLFRLPLLGQHNVYNSLAAVAIGWYMGIDVSKMEKGFLNVELSGKRMEIKKFHNENLLINDTYNANPTSMNHALNILSELEGKRKIAVLGDMLELGTEREKYHLQVGEQVATKNVDLLITRGPGGKIIGKGALKKGLHPNKVKHFSANLEAAKFLKSWMKQGDAILIKGSRGLQMEEIVRKIEVE